MQTTQDIIPEGTEVRYFLRILRDEHTVAVTQPGALFKHYYYETGTLRTPWIREQVSVLAYSIRHLNYEVLEDIIPVLMES